MKRRLAKDDMGTNNCSPADVISDCRDDHHASDTDTARAHDYYDEHREMQHGDTVEDTEIIAVDGIMQVPSRVWQSIIAHSILVGSLVLASIILCKYQSLAEAVKYPLAVLPRDAFNDNNHIPPLSYWNWIVHYSLQAFGLETVLELRHTQNLRLQAFQHLWLLGLFSGWSLMLSHTFINIDSELEYYFYNLGVFCNKMQTFVMGHLLCFLWYGWVVCVPPILAATLSGYALFGNTPGIVLSSISTMLVMCAPCRDFSKQFKAGYASFSIVALLAPDHVTDFGHLFGALMFTCPMALMWYDIRKHQLK